MIITSRDNKLVKYVKSLNQKKYRDKENVYFVEGIKMSKEALDYKDDIKFIMICEDLLNKVIDVNSLISELEDKKIEYYMVTSEIFNSISDTITPQGILVVLQKVNKFIEIKENGVYIVLDDVQDPGNVGTILRTMDAINADGLILSTKTADIYSPKVLRSTMGAIFRIPVEVVESVCDKLDELKKNGVKVVVSSLDSKNNLYQESFKNENTAIVIGNESKGVSDNVLDKADKKIKIPMPGNAESLNASVAAGVIMYEVAKQKGLLF